MEGYYKLYVGNPNKQALPEAKKASLRAAKNQAPSRIDAANIMLERYPRTVANISDKLYELIWTSEGLVMQATGMLGDYRY